MILICECGRISLNGSSFPFFPKPYSKTLFVGVVPSRQDLPEVKLYRGAHAADLSNSGIAAVLGGPSAE